MNYKLVFKHLGQIILIESAFLCIPLILAFIYGETSAATAFVFTLAISLLAGGSLSLLRPKDKSFFARDGFVTVSLSWVVMSLLGALPFFVSKAIPHYMDAFFETVSGFTTTGSSVLTDIEALPKSLLYWRSFTNWLGGMGVLVFLLAIIPLGKGNGVSMHLLRAESPGPSVGKLVPKMAKTARILYAIYIAMSLTQLVFLLCGGMPLFDSITAMFSTAGTGGFGIKNDSFASYSTYIQSVVAVFMMLFSINFNIYHLILLKDFKSVFKNQELRLYLGIVFVAIIAITINILPMFDTLYQALHQSFFQVSSIITTTGYASTDFNTWPEFSKTILVMLMLVGSCAGSTGGGMKVARVLLFFKMLKNELKRMIHPRSVKVVSVDNKAADEGVIKNVNAYLSAYLLILVVSILIISIDNMSFTTTTTAVISCLNNIGPGLDAVGPTGNFAGFSVLSKLILCADMLFGRLEIFPLIFLFSPSTWKKGS